MKITVEAVVNADIQSTWAAWNNPDDIKHWNAASADWHTPSARVDLREGGSFCCRMEAKDGSVGFDFEGVYTNVVEPQLIEYKMADGRCVSVAFNATPAGIVVTETFDAETEHSAELQQQGWQSILNRFANYVAAKA